MPQRIHFDQFELGIDRRKDESISDANRLVDCLNAYVTPGWAIRPRPGLTTVGTLTSGSKGLMAFNGKLQTFSDSGVTHEHLTDGTEVLDNAVPNVAYDIINDNFAANNGWSLGSDCTISGTMAWGGAQTSDSESYRNCHLKDGVAYAVEYTVARSAGSISCYLGDQLVATSNSAETVQENVTMDGETGRIRFVADSSFVGSVDNLTIGGVGAEVYTDSFNSDPNGWTFGGDGDISAGELRFRGSNTAGDRSYKDIGLVNTTVYEIEYKVQERVSGGVYIDLGGNVGTTRTANGTYTEQITMGDTSGEIGVVASANNSQIELGYITVREVVGVGELDSIPFADVFNGAIYVAAKYTNNDTKHHYLSGDADATTGYIITDEDCPHSDQVLINSSKVWATDYDIVRYSVVDNPTDWSTDTPAATAAGFLPTGTRATGSEQAIALGDFQGQLVVFSYDSIQLWTTDPDPQANAIDRVIGNVGARYPRAVQAVAGDLYFLTEVGFRSIAYQRYTENVEDVDIGTPIDDLVRASLGNVTDVNSPSGVFYAGGGQYWGFVDNQVYVYTFSRTSKIAAWTRYELPVSVEYAANLGGTLYIRSGDTIYKVDDTASTDDGTPFSVDIQMAFQSCQAPGVNKQFHGFDAVLEGSADISHRMDPNNDTVESDAITVTGDTRVGQVYPCGIVTTSIAPVIRNSTGTLERFNAISYLYDKIGAF